MGRVFVYKYYLERERPSKLHKLKTEGGLKKRLVKEEDKRLAKEHKSSQGSSGKRAEETCGGRQRLKRSAEADSAIEGNANSKEIKHEEINGATTQL